jgi:Rieske 2Fe-2S family protein
MTQMATYPGAVRTLPGKYYTDPEIFRLEQERIFSRFWFCVGLSCTLERGSYFLADVAGESVIVLRDRGDQVRAFLNVCRHRGARLCEAARGELRASIQCRYHAWTYGLDGRLIGAPNMKEDESFDPAERGLLGVPVRLWQGLIFVNLSDTPGPFEAQGEMEHPRFEHFRIDELRVARQIEYDVHANWKILVANYEECAHCALVHPELSARVPDFKEGLATGGLDDGAEYTQHIYSLTMSGNRPRYPLPHLQEEDYTRYYGMRFFPNAFLNLNPDQVGVAIMWPVAPDRTRVSSYWLFHPDAMAQPDFDPTESVEFSDLIKRQDWEVCELTQMGAGSRAFRSGGVYGPHERHIQDFDQEVLRHIGLLS